MKGDVHLIAGVVLNLLCARPGLSDSKSVGIENLDVLARVLKPGAELRFATDIDDYSDRTLRLLLQMGGDPIPAMTNAAAAGFAVQAEGGIG